MKSRWVVKKNKRIRGSCEKKKRALFNKVSNPTKLSEYLAFGITPIVLNPDVGDYFAMGYDYITLEDITTQLKCVKSIKNKELFNSYIAQMNAVKLPFMN